MKLLILLLIPFSAHALTFTWTPPVPVTGAEVVGYKLLCGVQSGIYTDEKLITDPLAVSHTVAKPDGVIYCAMKSYDAVGRESGFSNEATCLVQNNVCLQDPPNEPINLIVK